MSLLGSDAIVRAGGAAFRALVNERHEAFRAQLERFGIPPEYTDAWYSAPDEHLMAIRFTPTSARNQTPGPGAGSALELEVREMSAVFDDGLSLFGVRRMMEGVVPPTLCTASADHMPNVSYLSLCEYVDPLHIALSYQFFNRSRENVLATKRAALTLDDPYTGAGVVLQLEYLRTETEGPVFERLRAKLMGVASHVGMDKVFHLRGADIYRVLEMRRVPGRKELPAARRASTCPTNSRLLSERMANCEDLAELLDTLLGGLGDLLRIDHAMLWLFDSSQSVLTLLASRGYEFGGAGAEISVGEGIVGTAVREGVPIRVGHMMNMATLRARGARARRTRSGFNAGAAHRDSIARTQGTAQPARRAVARARPRARRAAGREQTRSVFRLRRRRCADAALRAVRRGDEPHAAARNTEAAGAATRREPPRPSERGPPLRLRRFGRDNSVFLDDEYLIRGVAGAILWKLVARVHAQRPARVLQPRAAAGARAAAARRAGQSRGAPDAAAAAAGRTTRRDSAREGRTRPHAARGVAARSRWSSSPGQVHEEVVVRYGTGFAGTMRLTSPSRSAPCAPAARTRRDNRSGSSPRAACAWRITSS